MGAVGVSPEGIVFEIDSSATPRQDNARQAILEVPAIGRAGTPHTGLRVAVQVVHLFQ
jgi:hypothetical protein